MRLWDYEIFFYSGRVIPLSHHPIIPSSHLPIFPLSHHPIIPSSHLPIFPSYHLPIVPSSRRHFFNFYALLMLFYAVIMQKIAKVICWINNFYYFCVMNCCRVIALPMPTNHLLNNETLFSNHINKQFL